MTVCEICGCQEFYLHDGKYYCQECNTQTKEREQFVEDKESTQFFGRQVKTSQHSFTVENFESWLTVEAFNIILKKQVESLIKLGSSGNLMHTVLQLWAKYLKNCELAFASNDENWLPKLSTIPRYRDYEVLSDNVYLSGNSGRERNEAPWETVFKNGRREYYYSHRKIKPAPEMRPFKRKRKSETSKKTDLTTIIESTFDCESSSNGNFQSAASETDCSTKNDEVDNSNIMNNFSQYAKNKLESKSEKEKLALWNRRHDLNPVDSLMLLHTICFCYAGILINHDHITLSDILRWIHDGEIPYCNAWTVLPKNMLPQKSDFRIFTAVLIPCQPKINRLTWNILKFVGITSVPSQPVEMFVLRIIAELNLPLILVKYIRQLVQEGPPALKEIFSRDWVCEQEDTFKTYSAKNKQLGVLSLCIVVLKIIFGLDGHREIELSETARLANKEFPKYFVFEEWLESIRLSFNFIKAVYPTQFKFNDREPAVCIDIDEFHSHSWKTSSIKEETIQQIHFYKAKNVKRKSSKTDTTNLESDKSDEVAHEGETFTVKMRKKKTNTSSIVDVNVNLRKILTSLIEDSAKEVKKATSFPLRAALDHHFLNDNPNSLVKRNFSHFQILTVDSKSSFLSLWKEKVNLYKLDFKEHYRNLPESFQTICDFSGIVFNCSPHELCKALSQIENTLLKWKNY